jgi:hypothetical protein
MASSKKKENAITQTIMMAISEYNEEKKRRRIKSVAYGRERTLSRTA